MDQSASEALTPQSLPPAAGQDKIAEALHAMAKGGIGSTGEPFFQSLTLALARILEAKYAMVALLVLERDRIARTLGWCCNGKTLENFSYSLIGTPCCGVADGEICCYPQDLQNHFPEDQRLVELGLQSYMGVPLREAEGRVLGIMSVFYDRPMQPQEHYLGVFQIFAVRAAAELERHQTETALRRSEERYALAACGSSGGVWDWDIESGGVCYSPRFLELLGYTAEEFPSLFYAWEQKIHPEDLPHVRTELENHLIRHQPFRVEYRMLAKSGEYRWFECRGQALWRESGEPYRMAGSILDIHERKQVHAHGLHDVLTGLPNRALLMDRFAQAVAHSNRTHGKLAVAFVDLDNFKQINDTHGHEVGDQVLIAVARRLSQAVRKSDTVARWGGDEMILLLSNIHEQNFRTVCERLKDRVQKQLTLEDGCFVTMSMGVAIFPDDAEDPEQLLQSADAALLLAKNRARNEVIFFGEFDELKSFRKKTHMRALLTSAVTERRIQVHYQPIVEAKTGRMVGAEALARWHEEEHGWLPPSLFIPMAESMGLIENLGRQVLEQALRDMERCHREGYSFPLSVNLSLRQLLRSDFTTDLLELMKQCTFKSEQLILEMTESQALLGLDSEARQMEQLSAAGFSLSLDDFGQGYSSLASLHDMPVRELKIDMKFMQHLHTKKGRRIVNAIVALSHTLGLETVAEGVDTQEQWTILKELGVQRLQGFLFSRPLPAEEFMAFVKNQNLTATPLGLATQSQRTGARDDALAGFAAAA
jgi:diguanylate cyclase (GGDEF)-like protein/PAS domain S-box-containing protein